MTPIEDMGGVTDAPPKRGPGRPKGSKNKPKDPISQLESESGNGDTPPRKGRGRPKGSRNKKKQAQVTKQIEETLAEILTAPAMPCAFMGDEWAVQHFTQNGRELASRLAEFSERNSQFRKWCESVMDTESILTLLLATSAYAIPPLMHWELIPGAKRLGIPQAERKREQESQPRTSDNTDWPERNGHGSYEDAEPIPYDFSDDEEVEPPTYI